MLNPLHIKKKIRVVLPALVVIFLVISGSTAIAQEQPDQRKLSDPTAPGYERPMENYDPWEGFNRSMYKFNYGVDKYFLLPVANSYDFVTPDVVQTGVTNFFGNLFEITNLYNNLLQGNPEGTVNTIFRFFFNSTMGIGGLFDPATEMGFHKADEDFGQTLAVWGAGPGPFLVLPVLGPSTVRDGIGSGVDSFAKSIWLEALVHDVWKDTGDRDRVYWTLTGLNAIQTRANVPFRYYGSGSPFEYELVRYVYLKGRQLKIQQRN